MLFRVTQAAASRRGRGLEALSPAHQLAIPAVVLAEAQAGVELTRKQDPAKAQELELWIDDLMAYYTILSADGPTSASGRD